MLRPIAAFLLLVLAACTTQAVPSPTAADPTPTATEQPSVEPSPTDAPGESATPEPDTGPAWTGHPAEGLAVVRQVAPDDPNTQVFVIEADGTARQVTGRSGSLGATFPVWSPDGEQIAFTGPKHGETTISGMVAVVNADGSDERQIAEGSFPRWSPDGTRIAFQEVDDVTGEDHSSYLVDPESGIVTDLGILHGARWLGNDRLTIGMNSYAADGLATESLYILDVATGETTFVDDWMHAFPSPDGTQIVLMEATNSFESTVWLADAYAQPIRELGTGGDVAWSQDGTMVAISHAVDQDANPVWTVVDLEGNVLYADIVGAYPAWSPDGTRMALEVYRPDQPVIQVVDLASGEIVWEERGRSPAWRP